MLKPKVTCAWAKATTQVLLLTLKVHWSMHFYSVVWLHWLQQCWEQTWLTSLEIVPNTCTSCLYYELPSKTTIFPTPIIIWRAIIENLCHVAFCARATSMTHSCHSRQPTLLKRVQISRTFVSFVLCVFEQQWSSVWRWPLNYWWTGVQHGGGTSGNLSSWMLCVREEYAVSVVHQSSSFDDRPAVFRHAPCYCHSAWHIVVTHSAVATTHCQTKSL